jgi:hypothetical protein
MVDSNSVGGVQQSSQRFDSPRHPAPERHPEAPQRDAGGALKPVDEVQLTDGSHVAFPLLRERVMARTRALCLDAAHVPAIGIQEALPTDPKAAVLQIQNLQRRSVSVRVGQPEVLEALQRAFAAGLLDAVTILREVGQWDESVAGWFFAVTAASA